jgi:hypothetical protein
MALNPATYSTRTLSLIMLAAFAGVALWIFQPWGGLSGGSGSSNGDASGALPPSLQVDGPVQVESAGDTVTRLVVPITLRGDTGISLDGSRLRAETELAETALAAVPATFDISFVTGNGDSILDPGESALVTVDLPATSSVHPENPLTLVFTTTDGGTLVIEDVLGD